MILDSSAIVAILLRDCLTYAVARLADQPLLFVGNDFSKTDLPSA